MARHGEEHVLFLGEVIDVPEAMDVAPTRFAFYPSYPNPSGASSVVRFDLPTAAQVTLGVFDVRGRRVATVLDRLAEV